jgi:two-component system phosphate regulon sensor histidine kinase PhoR
VSQRLPSRALLTAALLVLALGVWLATGVDRTWGLAAAAAGALAMAALLARAFLGPLDEIGRFAAALAAGEMGRRLRWRRRPAQDIADALDAMAEAVSTRIAEANSEKEQLQAVLAGMVEGVLVVNAAGRIVLANPRLRQMFAAWGEVAGRTPLEVIRHAGVDDALRAAAVTQQLVSVEIQVGGDERTILVNAVAFPAAGPRAGTVAVFHDVSDLRRLETMRRDFVANVSHELKTPLTAVRGFAETLLSGGVPPQDVEKYLGVILKHAERLGNLIDDLLELSRIESRKVPLQRTAVDVGRVVSGVMSGIEPQLRSKALSVKLTEETLSPTEALADRRAVEQVLTNLLDNAAKYTNPGGHIEVRLATARDQVRVEVKDDGIGIPEEDLPRIFERFYRVEKARSRDLGGTGLGLSIVKHLVQAMGGEIFVESRIGRGSSFTFTLPRAAEVSRSDP